MRTRASRWLVLLLGLLAAAPSWAAGPPVVTRPAWFWAALLFAFCLGLGVVAVIAGVGGGVLYVPLVDAIFPFHLDFVRGAGLWIAVAGALSAGPALLRRNLASLRLAVPCALVASLGSIAGARLGLGIRKEVVQTLLGVIVCLIAVVMVRAKTESAPVGDEPADPLAIALGMSGSFVDSSTRQVVEWRARRVLVGLCLVLGIGVLGGLFGVGAGWAKVPTLALVMGVPLKVATATSVFLIAMGDISGAWVYYGQGSVLPVMVVPSVIGLMLGARLGARLLDRARPALVRRIVVAVLLFAGGRSLLAGLGWLGG